MKKYRYFWREVAVLMLLFDYQKEKQEKIKRVGFTKKEKFPFTAVNKSRSTKIYERTTPFTANTISSSSSRTLAPDDNNCTTSKLLTDDKDNSNHSSLSQININDNASVRMLKFAEHMTPPIHERDTFILKAHLLGHYGLQSIENQLHHDGIHWTNMREDTERVLADYLERNKFNIAKVGYHPPKSVLPDQPLEHWCMDLGSFDVTLEYRTNSC
ncbi:hypothetical protein RMCBS344292_17437 [Rhizopus microsporus]|nr:hypothetical protein RMCBS344292_17437 [Rhizopus microsporus]